MSDDDNIIWSSETGRVRPDKHGKKKKLDNTSIDLKSLEFHLHREKKGGKWVCIIKNVPASNKAIKEMIKKMKAQFGVGGTIKGDVAEIQGDVRDRVISFLDSKDLKYKKIGG